jgi:hypothetical protein
MLEVSRERWHAYLDEALPEAEQAELEKAVRAHDELRTQLAEVVQARERGDHSLGTIWRRERITCPSREQLGSHLLDALAPELQSYIAFHLTVIQCPACLANVTDLQQRQQEPAAKTQQRRQRVLDSSIGLLSATARPD